MSTLVATERYSISAPVSAEALLVPLQQPASETHLHISFPDFHSQLAVPIIGFEPADNEGKVIAKASIDENISLLLSLTGNLIEGGDKFQPEQVYISIEMTDQKARADFIASTLWALLTLAEESRFQIPEIELDLKLNFELSLLEISKILQTRQTAYRLMVIERTTGKHFQLPEDYSGTEMEAIVFTYRAIVERSFVWPFVPTQIRELATRETLSQLPSEDNMRFETLPTPVIKSVLGEPISLGQGTVIIEDFFIPNADEVRRELAMNDGHPVEFVMDSVSGQAIYNLPEAPRLPDKPWDAKMQALIDLESQLDARLVERYHALAAATLADLTEEEKAEVTARPELDFGAFLMGDADGEDD